MEQDWQEVKIKARKPAGTNVKQAEVNRAQASGVAIETTKKCKLRVLSSILFF